MYKRQVSKRCVYLLGYQGNNLLCSDWDRSDMEGLDSVSYTHLDVYKRQSFGSLCTMISARGTKVINATSLVITIDRKKHKSTNSLITPQFPMFPSAIFLQAYQKHQLPSNQLRLTSNKRGCLLYTSRCV